jgi:hypothetical protein
VTVLVVDRPSTVEPDEARAVRRRSLARQQIERLQSQDDLMPGADTMILAQDALLVKGNPQAIENMAVQLNLGLQPIDHEKEHLTDCCCRRRSAWPR